MPEHVLHLIVSDDDFLGANRAREIYEEASKEVVDDMSIEIIDATVNKVDDAIDVCKKIISAAATMSLFGGKKVVWARNLNFLNDTPVGKSDQVCDILEQMAKTLSELSPNDAIVIINASPVNRVNKVFKTLSSLSDFEDFKTKDTENICIDLIKNEAKKLKVDLEHGVAETISAIVANNTRMALQEIRKLATYVNQERAISEKDVIDMVPIFGAGDFFEISNAFYSGNIEIALASLHRYFFTNKNASARPIISVLQRQNSLLIQLRALMDTKILPKTTAPQRRGSIENASNLFGKYFEGTNKKSSYNLFSQNDWFAGSKLAPIAAKFTLKQLIDIQMNLTKAFENLITRPNNDEAILRELFLSVR